MKLLHKTSYYTGYLNLAASMWLAFTMMFKFDFQRPALFAFGITYLIDYVVEKRWQKFSWNKSMWLYVGMIAFFLLIPIWNLWAETSDFTHHFIVVLERRLPFLLIGIMGLMGISEQIKLKYIAYTMIFSSLFAIFYLFSKVGFLEYITNPNRFRLFVEARILYLNPHMLFNLYLNCSLLGVFYLIMKPYKTKWRFLLLGIAEFLLLLALITTDGRTGFMTAVMLHAVFMLYGMWIWKRKLFKYSVILLGTLCVFAAALHPRVSFKSVTTDARYPIWNVATKLIAEKPILGYGLNDARIKFVERGENDEQFVNRYMKYLLGSKRFNGNKMVMHPHNGFLNALLEFGIIGLCLLLFILIYPIFIVSPRRRIYVFLHISIFAFSLMFECWGAQCPPLIYCFGLLLWLQGGFEKKPAKKVATE